MFLLVSIFSINVYALNEGRDYSMHESNGSSLSIILMIALIIFFIFLLLRSLFFNAKDKFSSKKEIEKTKYLGKEPQTRCDTCNGLGYTERKVKYGDKLFDECPYCYGYGKQINLKIKNQILLLEQKAKEAKNSWKSKKGIYISAQAFLYATEVLNEENLKCAKRVGLSYESLKLLEKYPDCPHCNGRGGSEKRIILRGVDRFLIEMCPVCNGRGEILFKG